MKGEHLKQNLRAMEKAAWQSFKHKVTKNFLGNHWADN